MITYKTDIAISSEQYIDLLKHTTLKDRRPLDNPIRINKMLANSDILITAWHNETLIGIARSVSDFTYCCYLSDLAVRDSWQKQGIGRQLILETKKVIDSDCKIILLAAPQAVDYYPYIGFEKHPSAWVKA